MTHHEARDDAERRTQHEPGMAVSSGDDDLACIGIVDPRVMGARLLGVAHRLSVVGVSAEQALDELLTITRDRGLMAEAGATALKGWSVGATRSWHTPAVAVLLIRAAAEMCPGRSVTPPGPGVGPAYGVI
ncbi:MAG TPA: hypothetical protein VGE14_07505 [Marmoricola sp.]